MAYRTIHKKSKAKKHTNPQVQGLGLLAVWVFFFAFCMWLTWVLWIGVQNGPTGKAVHDFLFKIFGQVSLLIPLFLMYWLARTLKSKTISVITSLTGFFFTFAGLCTLMAFAHNIFIKSALSGGKFGNWSFDFITSIAGKAGACIFALAFIFIGLHILFAIPWLATLRKTGQLLQNDFNSWLQARAAFKQEIQKAKEQEKTGQNKPRRVVAEDETQQDNALKEHTQENKKPMPKISRPVAEMITMPPRTALPQKQSLHNTQQKENTEEQKTKKNPSTFPPAQLKIHY